MLGFMCLEGSYRETERAKEIPSTAVAISQMAVTAGKVKASARSSIQVPLGAQGATLGLASQAQSKELVCNWCLYGMSLCD